MGGMLFFFKNYKLRCGIFYVLLILILISTGWLPRYLTLKLEKQYPMIKQADPTIHWVVVLGAGTCESDIIAPNNCLPGTALKRLLEGVRLYRQLPDAKLLLSGGGYGEQLPEAQYLGIIASWFIIPKQNIVLETRSVNTATQAKEIKPIIQSAPFYLVTSGTHMLRSMKLFEAQGLHPIAAPTDYTCFFGKKSWDKIIIPNPYNLKHLSVIMHELLGLTWSSWHHYAS